MARLTELFLQLLNMSISASIVALFVMLARLCLKRAPKWFSYLLWTAVGFRLIFSTSFGTQWSLFNFAPPPINVDGRIQYITGTTGGETAVFPTQVQQGTEAGNSGLQIGELLLSILAVVWILGVLLLICYSLLSYVKVSRRMATAVKLRDNIYLSDRLTTPFVMGSFRPKIYIPFGLETHEEEYILRHEQTHVRRGDHIFKPLAYILLCIYWFNPLIWISFYLFERDMEMSCDERVLHDIGQKNAKADYSETLLRFSTGQWLKAGSAIAFGEPDVVSRIKNILRWHERRPVEKWAVLILCAGILLASVTNPWSGVELSWEQKAHNIPPDSINYLKEVYIDSMDFSEEELTLSARFVNNSKVSVWFTPSYQFYKVNADNLEPVFTHQAQTSEELTVGRGGKRQVEFDFSSYIGGLSKGSYRLEINYSYPSELYNNRICQQSHSVVFEVGAEENGINLWYQEINHTYGDPIEEKIRIIRSESELAQAKEEILTLRDVPKGICEDNVVILCVNYIEEINLIYPKRVRCEMVDGRFTVFDETDYVPAVPQTGGYHGYAIVVPKEDMLKYGIESETDIDFFIKNRAGEYI